MQQKAQQDWQDQQQQQQHPKGKGLQGTAARAHDIIVVSAI